MHLDDLERFRQIDTQNMLAPFARADCTFPVFVHRDCGLRAFAPHKETLVIVSSHSGNTEETLHAFEAAVKQGCTMVAVCPGGELAERVAAHGVPLWKFDHAGQPRAAPSFPSVWLRPVPGWM